MNPATKIPNLFFNERTNSWVTKIGYFMADSGRQRCYQYIREQSTPAGELRAKTTALALADRWQATKDSWGTVGPLLESIQPSRDWSKPVWFSGPYAGKIVPQLYQHVVQGNDNATQVIRRIDIDSIERAAQRNPDIVVKAVDPLGRVVAPTVTLEIAKQKYLEHLLNRTTLVGRLRLKKYSYSSKVNDLETALRPQSAEKIKENNPEKTADKIEKLIERKPIDLALPLSQIGKKEIQDFINYWWSDFIQLADRTRKNYCVAFRQLLEFCADADDEGFLGFNLPRGIDAMFSFPNTNPINIRKYDPQKLIAIMKQSKEKCRLYQLIALNCGQYQGDVANLRTDEIVTLVDGEPTPLTYKQIKNYDGSFDMYIYRLRDRTEHKNRVKTLHWLFPETGKLLTKYLAPENKAGLALLNATGLPLLQTHTDKRKQDAISSCFWRAAEAARVELAAELVEGGLSESKAILEAKARLHFSFKQFRKVGATELEKIGGDQITRMYRSQGPAGDKKYYVIDDFSKLTDALKKWAEKLRADGVLN